jgi:hypothetical protein
MKDDFIIEFKNAYPDELCDEFINEWVTPTYHLMSEMHPNLSMDDHLKNKSSQDMYFELGGHRGVRHGCGAHDILNDKYQDIMKNVKEKYTDILIEKGLDRLSQVPPEAYMLQEQIRRSVQSGIVMARTDPGQYYNWHADYVYGQLSRQRLLTCILYLNDMDEDAGGCTEFSNGRAVRPEKGKVLIFPATHVHIHRGAPVNKGSKYVVTTFAREPPPVYNGGLPFIVKPDKH